MKTFYKIEGTPNSPVLIFSNSLGTTLEMWDEVVPFLLPYFRIVRYDTRGHGRSETTLDPYSIELLGNDVIELMDLLGIEEVAFCGLSMGGLIGQWLAVYHPERIRKLVLSNTTAKIGEESKWDQRIQTILTGGMQSIADSTMQVWFTKEFKDNEKVIISKDRFLECNTTGYANCCAAIRDADFRNEIASIKANTLIIAGTEDKTTTVHEAKEMTEKIPKSELNIISANHLSATEIPVIFSELLINFLVGNSSFERGMHVRRTVLGNEHVDNANTKINDFNRDFQTLVTNVPWATLWTRPGITKRDRSLITLSVLIALGKETEFKMHVKAAFNNGVTEMELKELILHSSAYCGFPATNEAFKLAEETIETIKKTKNN